MAVAGDWSVAGLLSGLAEAPDFRGAASFLLAELIEHAGGARAALMRLDVENENLVCAASAGFEPDTIDGAIPIHDLSNPLLVSTLSILAARGRAPLGIGREG